MSIELAEKLMRLGSYNILCVGDLCEDVDVHGHMDRYAAELPGCPVFHWDSTEFRYGGVGAVWRMVQALGSTTRNVCGHSSIKTRFFVEGRQVWRYDRDSETSAFMAADAMEMVKHHIRYANTVLIADYGKGLCTNEVLRAAIDGATQRGIPVIIDPHRNPDWSRYKGATAIKCNSQEWENVTEPTPSMFSRVLVTRGKKGLDMSDWNEGPSCFPTRQRNAIDPTGCGDMVLASLGVCVAGSMSWPEACQVANAAAGLKVERHGAVPVSRGEVIADLCHGEKVLPLDLLASILDTRKVQGKKIVLANGCFDLLHVAHCHMLAWAKEQGDILVAAVNDDESVRELKGPGRPILPLASRMSMLAAQGIVDYVISFPELNPTNLIQRLKPDVLVKGPDNKAEEVPGRHLVEVRISPLVYNGHTSDLIEQIKRGS
jgi:D-beta-D-heptose 7-phosphate kinase / D-beta-D-heptose 1-phosphate adenosyltransferase